LTKGPNGTLLDPNLDMEARKQLYKEFSEAQKRYKIAWDIYKSLPQTQEEARLWKEFVAAWQEVKKGNNAFFQLCTNLDKTDIMNPMALRAKIESFRGDHYRLLENPFHDPHRENFRGGDSVKSCPFGKWAPTFKTTNAELLTSLKGILDYHDEFHEAVGKIRALVEQGDTNGARALFEGKWLPPERQ